ncbi:MAG: hypothetical protein GY806_12235, partial [Gammaproteobacteria bacterium]|nr:hypothetical protein [Gammaproteobacteria bacterium]
MFRVLIVAILLIPVLFMSGCGSSSSSSAATASSTIASFVIVDTNQAVCYDSLGATITCGASYAGQDAEYAGPAPDYTNNGDSTVTDNNTSLMWAATTINNVDYADSVTTA